MIRLALGKGRNLAVAVAALRSAGLALDGLGLSGRRAKDAAEDQAEEAPQKGPERRLIVPLPDDGLEVLLLKDADLPLYVAYGVADLGVVGSDLLEEADGDLLVPARFREGRSRLSLIGLPGGLPRAGDQVRLATKYPGIARRVVASRSWGAEILTLSGSIELAPLLDLAEIALDIVQTGRTLADNGLVELETVAEVAPCLVVNRASFLRHRERINRLVSRLDAAGVIE